MAGDFGSTGGINSRGMPDRVERAFSRRGRGGTTGTVGPDYEQDIIPYTKKRFYQHYPGAVVVWALFHSVTGLFIIKNVDSILAFLSGSGPRGFGTVLCFFGALVAIANVVLVIRWRMFQRFKRIAITEEDKKPELLDVFE